MKQKRKAAKGFSSPSSSSRPGRKRKDLSDITPSTSLPPLVEGQLRCFLKLTVSKILWMVSKPPSSFLIRVRWWGETSDGTVFTPRDPSQAEQKTLKTTTRYPVRCGPKQFTAYLTDMGALILEVLTKSDRLPIGRVQISGLAQLSPSHPISGFFTIVSPTSEKMGELQVSVVLEPLSETYDSSSSIPNTDVSFSAGLPASGAKEALEASQFLAPPPHHRPLSANVIGRESLSSSRASTPRGKDHLYFQENSENLGPHHHLVVGQNDIMRGNNPKQHGLLPSSSDHEAQMRLAGRSPKPVRVLSSNNAAAKDLISALLDRGSRLRDAMVVSAMKSSPDSGVELHEAHPAITREVHRLAGKSIKNPNAGFAVEDPLHQQPDYSEFDLEVEDRAVQLLLGSSDLSSVRLLDGTHSPLESLSLRSEICDSELNDPQYDQSLLENLFYTAQKSDSSLSDFPSEEEGAVASGKQKQSRKGRSQKSSKSSPSDPKKKKKASHSPARPIPPHETSTESTEETQHVNLSLDRLAVLSRIHLARMVVESLKIPLEDGARITPGKRSSAGKPPRPTLAKKRTYFVEFHFPVGTLKTGAGQGAITTEVVRVASSKISGEVVKFQQRSVFPVHFSGSMITHWWNSDLEFNIFLKKGTERKPLLVGSAVLSLRDVIQSELLMVNCDLPVKEGGVPAQLGPLKVSLELAADNKDFSATNTRAVNVASQAPVYSVRSPGVKFQNADKSPRSAESPHLLKQSSCQFLKRTQETSEKPSVESSQYLEPRPMSRNLLAQIVASEEEGLLLHVLLMVPEGQVFVPREAGLLGSCNVYLNCKLFNTKEATRSAVIWGTTQPAFHFSQVMPISLTSKCLERLKNNVMVIEAWNKVHSPGGDRLLGLVKLPLHQFYISFKDPAISSLLLQAQYPVLAVDGPMPLVDVFSGKKNGSLVVILAMGSADQIASLQRLKSEEGMGPAVVLRPPHALDPPLSAAEVGSTKEGLMEHVFEIHLESIKGLTPLQSTVWGEADCYVQYHFPVQESESSDVLRGAEFSESGFAIKPFRSATTLCVLDPTFSEERHHALLVPADIPVQRLLLSAFSAQGIAGGGGGIQFEVWCRYYYPNVRDQMVARGTLPLSRLCALVTLQHRDAVGIQTFSLPLIPRTDTLGEHHPRSSGFLDVSIRYRRSLKVSKGILAAQTVSISVQIHSAAGLQAAARALAEKNPLLQYSAEVGVNTYISVHIPFLPETERRNTRPVARTFCPEFEHHMEFPCNLVVQRSSGEACCLGELLQHSEIVFSVFHQNLNSASSAVKAPALRDYLLGTVKVATKDLLVRRSGIRGWYPVNLPEDVVPSDSRNFLETIVGGLELSVTFAHPGDRERVLDAAALLGWNWEGFSSEKLQEDSEDECQSAPKPATVTVSIPRLWLPLQCVLLAGQTHLNRSIYCYLRYKLYDQEATWTSLRRPKCTEDQKHVTVTFKKSHQMDLQPSQALWWYFREERLELQVWRAFGNESHVERPLDTDRLIGSAFVDLSALGGSARRKRTVSGVFPLFRRNASNLWGAAVRVHIALASTPSHGFEPGEEGSHSSSSEGEENKEPPEQNVQVPLEPNPAAADILTEKSSESSPPAVDHEKTFAVSILVERAMHLSLKGSPLTERGVTSPSSYVSFVAAGVDNPIATDVIENTESPVWGFQQQTRLSNELLLDSQQTLVFKVWHKADVERVIGFASVDLSPLLSGFQLVCGWYNITDFSGQCQGQIKVAVSPLENITHLKKERQERNKIRASGSSVRDLYAAFPAFSSRSATEVLFSTPLRSTEVPTHQGKNLCELDEIQKYFSQKLTRPFPDVDLLQRPTDKLSQSRQNSATRLVDPEGCQLLEKSNNLVSQVSSLIIDLQNNMLRNATEESLDAHEDGTRHFHAKEPLSGVLNQREEAARTKLPKGNKPESSPCVEKAPLFPPGPSSSGRDLLYEFLGQGSSQDDLPFPSQREEGASQSHSEEEEYEEDVVEPRMLNEITTVTDKTSPWSSLVSEPEQEPEQREITVQAVQHLLNEDSPRISSKSSVTQEEPQSVPSTVRSSNSPFREDVGDDEHVMRQDLESCTEELLQPAVFSPVQQTNESAGNPIADQEGELNTPGKGVEEEACTSDHEDGNSSTAAVPEMGSECLHSNSQDGEEADPSEERHSRPESSCDEEGHEEPTEESDQVPKSTVVLSDPIVIPNFFLPPQHLEASMRLLSVSTSSPAAKPGTSGSCGGGDAAAAPGTTSGRQSRQKLSLMPAELPEEETKRIARIFSMQFSKRT
nr:C2 domain-containing protein 3 [Anolis sagrei ordinatus]